ncbi:hypothetical protein ACHAWX_001489 [Stephanocyclus meneghinianus]
MKLHRTTVKICFMQLLGYSHHMRHLRHTILDFLRMRTCMQSMQRWSPSCQKTCNLYEG